MKKKFLALLMGGLMLCSSAPVMADTNPFVIAGNQMIEARLIDSKTYIPMRSVFEALGYTVYWNNDARMVYLTKSTSTLSLYVDTGVCKGDINGTLENLPKIVDGSTLLPLRELLEGMGYVVNWDDTTRTATVLTRSAADALKEGLEETAKDVADILIDEAKDAAKEKADELKDTIKQKAEGYVDQAKDSIDTMMPDLELPVMGLPDMFSKPAE